MNTGVELKDWILAIVGNVFIVILAVRAVGSWAKREWGDMITMLCGAAVIVGFVYFTDSSINILKSIWNMLFQ